MRFYNNTFDENNSGNTQSCDCAAIKTSTAGTQTGIIFKNNLFLNFADKRFDPNVDGTFAAKYAAIDYNDYYGWSSEFALDYTGNQHYNWLASIPWNILGGAGGRHSFPGLHPRLKWESKFESQPCSATGVCGGQSSGPI